MACLLAKTVHGKRYWQLVTSRLVNGQSRHVLLAHLGSADRLWERLQGLAKGPLQARVFDFGAVAACWSLVQDLGLIDLINRHAPKRDQGLSVGEYLALAAINRVVAPTSKTRLGSWYRSTALRRLLPCSQTQLRSQRFWDHMDVLDEKVCRAIEQDLSTLLVKQFQLDLRCLCFDCTNFDTFIDSTTPGADLAQRGHAKSKRTDLRVVGLALLVSTDFHVPLFFQVYPGNQPDSVTFASVVPELEARYRQLAPHGEPLTLVFDKGNNAEETFHAMASSPYRLLGSLVPSQHPALLQVPLSRFDTLSDKRLEGVSAYRTRQRLFDRVWTVVVTRSQELLDGQLRGIAQHLHKRRQALHALQVKLQASQQPNARGKGYTRDSLQKHIQHLTQGQYLHEFLSGTIHSSGGKLRLSYRTDPVAFERLKRTTLGKRILFTDNHTWSTPDIILGYRAQHHVEAAFRQMKDPFHVAWDPLGHWTDQKIRVHALYCVIALILGALLHRKVAHAGLSLSLDQILQELAAIKEVITLSPSTQGRPPTAQVALSRLSPLQKRLSDVLGLASYQPR